MFWEETTRQNAPDGDEDTPCYLMLSNLIGFKGDGVAATEDARRTGEENK